MLATAVSVMGPEKGMELIEKLPDTEGIIVARKGNETKILTSRNLRNLDFSY
jgi:thiamine biosynthesis lipoprotein ApbE